MNRTKTVSVITARAGARPQAPQGRAPGVFARVLGTAVAALVLVVAVLFSAVLLAAVLLIGAIGLGWFWWQTRAVRRALREQVSASAQRPADAADGEVGRPMQGTRRARAQVDDITDVPIIREVQVRDRR